MANYTFVHIEHPEGLRLIDLLGVEIDLQRCRNMCKAILPRTHPGLEMDALAVAILTVYGRVYSGGVRDQARIPVDTLFDAEERDLHAKILHARSKHAVHSINDMETAKLRAWLNPEERGGRKVNHVNADAVNLVTLDNETYVRLHALCAKALVWVGEQKLVEEARLMEIVARDFTLDELYSGKVDVATTGDLNTADRGRKRTKA